MIALLCPVPKGPHLGGMPNRLIATIATGLLLTAVHSLGAQRLRGQIVLPDSATPAPGAMVVATDHRGTVVRSVLADAQGLFDLLLPPAGSVEVRVLRVGFRPTPVGSFDLADGEARSIRIVLAGTPITLPKVTVRGKDLCGSESKGGLLVASVWDEARKALMASRIVSGRPLVAEWITFDRSLDPGGTHVRQQRVHTTRSPTTHAFKSLPAETLATSGYIVADSASTMFYAPDADVLLSESFAFQHCFHVEPPPAGRAELIGVGFTPTRDRGNSKDIEGTLWLDRTSAELRSLEYRYTNVLGVAARVDAGGRVEFLRLASGEWLVSRWRILMPQVGEAERIPGDGTSRILVAAPDAVLTGVQLSGGEVTSIWRGDSLVYRADGAALSVQVVSRDSLVPAVGANVSLLGTDYAATADASGRARIAPVLAGSYRARVRSALMDTLGASPVERDVEVRERDAVVDSIALPTAADLLRAACGRDVTRAAVCGRLAEAARASVEISVFTRSGVPIEGATVELTPHAGASRTVRTLASGHALVTAVDPGLIRVRARSIGFKAGELSVSVAAGRNTVPIILDAARSPTLDTVRVMGNRVVLARYQEFEARRLNHEATASFTEEDIEKRNPTQAWQMLTTLPSLNVTDRQEHGEFVVVATSNRGMITGLQGGYGNQPCFLKVMIDGVLLPADDTTGRTNLNALPAPSMIHGIEVFAGPASIPLRYTGAGDGKWCGLIAIWTK
jgi:hypothetical protein